MDRAVLDARGWTDIPTDCEFLLEWEDDEEDAAAKRRRRKPWRLRWPDDVRAEVLARLLALNAERAAAEAQAGQQSDTASARRRATPKGRAEPGQTSLDGGERGQR